PVFELALHGVMIQALEEEQRAQRYLVAASLNRDEALVAFSLLRAPAIAQPRRVSRLEIALEGVPKAIPAPSEGGQACERAGERLSCRVDREAPLAAEDPARLARYLRPTLAVTSADGEIVRLARELAAGAPDAGTRIGRILAWIEANIAREALDAFTAMDVLRERRAECQGHAYLFAALARAMGLPARVVNGLVYSEEQRGFLYHTWNEVHVAGAGWRPVDATFAQVHADATHLKLIEGETVAELAPLVGMIGRARIEALRALAHW
ncbi:MAG: transglutaminase-like domain-containing protein, partial [Burkholderiales bacterium]